MTKRSVIFGILLALLLSSTIVRADEGNLLENIEEETTKSEIVKDETDNMGSINIILQDTATNLSKKDVKFSLVKVAELVNGSFVMCDVFKSADVDVNEIVSANDMEESISKLMKIPTTGQTVVTDSEGRAEIKNLTIGVYLIYSIDAASYAQVVPCLVSIPTYDEQIKKMNYQIEVLPKYTTSQTMSSQSIETTNSFQTGIENNASKYVAFSIGLMLVAVQLCLGEKRKCKSE